MRTVTHRGRRAVVATVVVLAALLAVSCSRDSTPVGDATPGSTQPPSNPVTGGVMNVAVIGSPDGFSPSNSRFTPATYQIAKAIYDPIAVVAADGSVVPYLAESLTPNADFTAWTVKARAGIKFHNGQPLDATALKMNAEALPKGIISGQAAKGIQSVDIIDPLTIRINLNVQNAHLPLSLTGQAGFVLAPAQLESKDPNVIIGTGPFKYKEWIRDSKFTAVRNDDYWRKDQQGRQLPYLSQVTFMIVPDASSRMSALRAGDVDLVQTANPGTVTQAADGSLGELQSMLDRETGDKVFMVLNNLAGPFQNKELRIAANEAIDRTQFIESMLKPGLYKEAKGPIVDGSPWGDPKMPSYNIDSARQRVSAATGGQKAPVTLTVLAGDPEALSQAQFLQSQLNNAGFDVNISSVELTAFSLQIVTAKSDMFLFSFWTDTDPDPDYPFLVTDTAGDPGTFGLNFARWRNPQVDAAMKTARASADDTVRRQQYQIVWDQMSQDAPYVFLYENIWAIVWRPQVYNIGFMTTPDGVPMRKDIWGSLFITNVWMQ